MENLMGGIVAAFILPIEDVISTECTRGTINITMATDAAWQQLPLMYSKSTDNPDAQLVDGELLYSSNLTLTLVKVSQADLLTYSDIVVKGCLVKLRMSDGSEVVYGTKDYPMVGTVNAHRGGEPSDSARTIMEVSNGSLLGPLQPL